MRRILYLSLTISLSVDIVARSHNPRKTTISTCQLQDGAATILIHGTLFSNALIPQPTTGWLGIKPASLCGPTVKRISKYLGTSPDSCYFFRWSGKLSPQERKKAARHLASLIRTHTGPIRLICHSHGCNVALLLAELDLPAQHIEKLILLAPPVQKSTSHLVASPLFKKVISLYSTGDLLQVADPQGLQSKNKESLFSKRLFDESPNLIQARILIDRRSPSHIDFILTRFLKKLSAIITLLEEANLSECIVNIPPGDRPPQVVHKDEVAYLPRAARGSKRFLA